MLVVGLEMSLLLFGCFAVTVMVMPWINNFFLSWFAGEPFEPWKWYIDGRFWPWNHDRNRSRGDGTTPGYKGD